MTDSQLWIDTTVETKVQIIVILIDFLIFKEH